MSSGLEPFVPVGRVAWDEQPFKPKGEVVWDNPNPSPEQTFGMAVDQSETDMTEEEKDFLVQQEGMSISNQPRGIRNNNPGNIELGEDWEGMAEEQSDGRFIQFQSPEYGIRAMAKLFGTYKEKYGIETIEGIVSRYAPDSENDTEAYINSVVSKSGIGRTKKLSGGDLAKVIKAMIHHENGAMPYDDETIAKGVELAKIDG